MDGEPYHGQAWSITDRIFEWMTPAIKKAVNEKTETLLSFEYLEGIYTNIWDESFVIFLDGKMMIVNPKSPDPKNDAWLLEPVSENSFRITSTPRYSAVGEMVVFKRNPLGKITGYASGEGGEWMEKLE